MKVLVYSIGLFSALALTGISSVQADDALAVADRLARQNLAYIYGSEDLHNGGLDCSGFVQIIFRESCGLELPNQADKQLEFVREHGQVWDSTSNWTPAMLQPGDLIFYAGPNEYSRISHISHVMVYCGHNTIVGSQGAGRRLGEDGAGVGYYGFYPWPPKGVLGESGDRFVGNRQVFAYGRLNGIGVQTGHESVASGVFAPSPASKTVAASSFTLKPAGIDPRFD